MSTSLNKHENLIKINFNRNNKRTINYVHACKICDFAGMHLKNILLPIDREINHITKNRNNHQVLLCKLITLLASESLALSLMITSFCCSTCSSKCWFVSIIDFFSFLYWFFLMFMSFHLLIQFNNSALNALFSTSFKATFA